MMGTLLIPLAGNFFDWLNGIAADAYASLKTVLTVAVAFGVTFLTFRGGFTLTKLLILGLTGALLVAIIWNVAGLGAMAGSLFADGVPGVAVAPADVGAGI